MTAPVATVPEHPERPELVLDANNQQPEALADQVIEMLTQSGKLS